MRRRLFYCTYVLYVHTVQFVGKPQYVRTVSNHPTRKKYLQYVLKYVLRVANAEKFLDDDIALSNGVADRWPTSTVVTVNVVET